MKMFLKLTTNFLITSWFVLLWFHTMLLSSDIPVMISYEEMKGYLQTLIISTIPPLVYIKFVKDTNLHYFLSIPTLLWIMSSYQALTHNFHAYDTLNDIVSLLCSLLIILYSILQKRGKHSLSSHP